MPGAQLARFVIPAGDRDVYAVVLARERHGDGDASDEVTVSFDRYTGAEVALTEQSTMWWNRVVRPSRASTLGAART